MLPYANYSDVKEALRRRQPFEGNSMSAVRYRHENGERYTVFSYSTVIASVDIANNGREHSAWYSDRRYSVTTSCHQTLVRAYLLNAEMRITKAEARRRDAHHKLVGRYECYSWCCTKSVTVQEVLDTWPVRMVSA